MEILAQDRNSSKKTNKLHEAVFGSDSDVDHVKQYVS